ncbi:hypothetical protein [Methylobacterium indicum]|uniref:Transcriptional regulator n=1 Tax=Methylobacterium indicum TaxID=1775910 RepID=A0ABR5HEZ3_9HYPH|nr:hypothetical protein [Methylobacterium indicum]KMO25060.1 hypothetical protein QR79_09830 [Methylobacterium indicum]
MANSDNTVLAKPLRYFRGQEGEGDAGDGNVTPDSKPFRVDRARFAELKANGLVEEAGDEPAAEESPADDLAQTDETDAGDDTTPRRGRRKP